MLRDGHEGLAQWRSRPDDQARVPHPVAPAVPAKAGGVLACGHVVHHLRGKRGDIEAGLVYPDESLATIPVA